MLNCMRVSLMWIYGTNWQCSINQDKLEIWHWNQYAVSHVLQFVGYKIPLFTHRHTYTFNAWMMISHFWVPVYRQNLSKTNQLTSRVVNFVFGPQNIHNILLHMSFLISSMPKGRIENCMNNTVISIFSKISLMSGLVDSAISALNFSSQSHQLYKILQPRGCSREPL